MKIKWMKFALAGAFLLGGARLWAAPSAQLKQLTPTGLKDLKVAIAFANHVSREHNLDLRNQTLVRDLLEVGHRCARAKKVVDYMSPIQNYLADFSAQVHSQIEAEFAKNPKAAAVFDQIPLMQARQHTFAMAEYKKAVDTSTGLQQSIARKLKDLNKSLWSQPLVSSYLNGKPLVVVQNEPIKDIVREIPQLKSQLQNPNELIQNVKAFLNVINANINGTSAGYERCVNSVDSLGLGQS